MRRGMTLGVRAVVIDSESRVLLVKHGYTPGWHFPGGGVEPGETTRDALVRELDEEAGIALDGNAELFGLYFSRHISRRDHVAVFVCRQWHQARQPRIPNLEVLATRFCPWNDLPEGVTDGTRRRVGEIFGGNPAGADW
jgi:8-oxo-dGTP pyrophosphatase MutT (NUDIX family)